MRYFSVRLLALAVAFVAGWLFSNEVRAPRYDELSVAVWAAFTLVGVVLMALGGR